MPLARFVRLRCEWIFLREELEVSSSFVPYATSTLRRWVIARSPLVRLLTRRKYYDDCAQILSEHVLATMKPTALHRLSTLDPLVTFRLNQLDETVEEKKADASFLSRAASMLQGEPRYDEGEDDDGDRSVTSDVNSDFTRTPDNGDASVTAATTLVDGALPVREFPNDLTSAPAAIAGTESDGFYDDNLRRGVARSGSISKEGTHHQEELRCVLAIIRHGDRTPKQKLKVNMSEPHILGYFHDR